MADKDNPNANERPDMDDISPKSTPPPPFGANGTKQSQQHDADEKRVELQEAMQYWGQLVQNNNCASEKLDKLLGGIANYISSHFKGIEDCPDLSPTQLAAFYRAVGGNYDVLFVETQPSSISFIYKALGCLHSIQPRDASDGHEVPSVPALKVKGFVKWQTIQLLLSPEEHAPFLQNAVAQFDITDPITGQTFPKVLPEDALPKEPDPAMLRWYEQVHDKLQQETQDEPKRSLSLSDATASEQSGDERAAAAYFQNSAYRHRGGRPAMASPRGTYKSPRSRGSRQASFTDRGKAVVDSVRHFISPPTSSQSHQAQTRQGRRYSNSGRYRDDDEDALYEDETPTGLYPEYKNKPPRPRERERESSPQRPSGPELIETDSDSDGAVHVHKRPPPSKRISSRERREQEARDRDRERDRRERALHREIKGLERERQWEREDSPGSKRDSKSPPLRHRRSYEPQVSPVGYFPRPFFEDEPRRHSHAHPGLDAGAGGFAPSNEPSMASRVANMQRSSRTASPRVDESRGSMGSSYPPRSVPVEERGTYNGRPTVRYNRRSIDKDRERPRYERGGQGSDEYLPRPDMSASRSRSYERDRDADRLRQSTRYVEGAHRRKYPSQAPWQS